MTLEEVSSFHLPPEIVTETEQALRAAGEQGFELFVLWSGEVKDRIFRVESVHVPEQASYKTPSGLVVKVEGNALHRLNVWLHENEKSLGVQIHAHPGDAYHSSTDDSFPIVTMLGGLSIVVPDFTKRGLLVEGTAYYRLTKKGWSRVRGKRVAELVQVHQSWR